MISRLHSGTKTIEDLEMSETWKDRLHVAILTIFLAGMVSAINGYAAAPSDFVTEMSVETAKNLWTIKGDQPWRT